MLRVRARLRVTFLRGTRALRWPWLWWIRTRAAASHLASTAR